MSQDLRIHIDANSRPRGRNRRFGEWIPENCVLRANAGDVLRAVPIQSSFSHSLGQDPPPNAHPSVIARTPQEQAPQRGRVILH